MEMRITEQEALRRRQSTRAYDMAPLTQEDLDEVVGYAQCVEPLVPGVATSVELVGPDDVKSVMKWRAPHYLAVYTPAGDGGGLAAGHLAERVVLRLTAAGIATCMATSVTPKEPHAPVGAEYRLVVAFGRAEGEAWREGADGLKRKAMGEVSDTDDPRLEAARIAPSAMNGQPWRFAHNGDGIRLFREKPGLLKKMMDFGAVDCGIALANLEVANGGMTFEREEGVEAPKKQAYLGTIRL